MNAKEIPFKLVKINTPEFATFEDHYSDKAPIQLKVSISFGLKQEEYKIACICTYIFFNEENPVIKFTTSCEFQIKEEAWSIQIDEENNEIEFEPGFLRHLAMLTVGTSRGVLHAKTEGTKFNTLLLPTINVTKIIKGGTNFKL